MNRASLAVSTSRRSSSPLLAVLAVAVAAPLALWETRFHVVPTVDGRWRGISDPPGALRLVLSATAAILLAWLLRRAGRRCLPLVWLGLAVAPLVPVLTGRLDALLAFQGPVLALVATAALVVTVVAVLPPPPAARARL